MAQCIAGQGIVIPQVYFGAGRHIEYIDPLDFQTAFKLNFVSQPIYLFGICLVKISVGFFLLRIAVKPFYKRLIITIMGKTRYSLSILPSTANVEQFSWESIQ